MSTIAVLVTWFLLTWSRSSTADVIVSTTWLYERMSSVIILEATYSRTSTCKANMEHIPGAALWDMTQCSWPSSTRPRNDPEELCLQLYANSLGVDKETPVVIYDRSNMQLAARTWWTLSMLHGRNKVSVLDGGWAEWTRHELPTTTGRYRQCYNDTRGNWAPKYQSSRHRDLNQMTADVRTANRQVLDARLPQHYRGDDSEPCQIIVNELVAADLTLCRRMLQGHLLSAINVPWTSVVSRQFGRLRILNRRQLVQVFQSAGVNIARPLTTTSYVGNAACLVALAAVHCGARDVAVYTGSWMEWAQIGDARLVVQGDVPSVLDGRCPKQWKSLKTAFMTTIVADWRKSALNCNK